MKMTVEKGALIKALGQVQGIAERRNTIPILANALIEVSDGFASFTATDMEIAMTSRMPVEGAVDGRITVPAATLYDIVRKLPDGQAVSLSATDSSLSLTAGRFATNLNVLPAEEFPSMATGNLPHRFTVPTPDLLTLLSKAGFAMSSEETRYYLNGILFGIGQGDAGPTLRAVATDGHRLARIDVALPAGTDGMPSVIVPRKTVRELARLVEGTKEVEVGLSDTRIVVTAGEAVLRSKLIDGTFPEYERVIPRENDRILTIAKRDLMDAVSRVGAVSNDRARPVKMSVATNSLAISVSSADMGTAEEQLDEGQVEYAGDAFEVGFQARYVNDIADQIAGKAEFRFGDPSTPVVIVEPGKATALYVLMPMRI